MRRGQPAYLVRRLAQTLIVLWIIATILFLIFRLAPGNPLTAYIDTTFTAEQQRAVLEAFGLDKPLPVQYVLYMGNLLKGEFGRSFSFRSPVAQILRDVFPNTIWLTFIALIFAYIWGIVNGVLLAWRRGTPFETLGLVGVLMTRAAPQFWVGMIVLSVFSFGLGWFPSSGIASPGSFYANELEKITSPDFWRHVFLPAFTLAIYLQGLPTLLMRSNMLDVMEEDFVTMARMKGLSEWTVMLKHAARNALLPVVTAMALGVGYAVGGNVLIETVFSYPGLGRILVRAVAASDYPLAQGAFFLIAVVIVSMNFIADLLYSLLDPRVSTSR